MAKTVEYDGDRIAANCSSDRANVEYIGDINLLPHGGTFIVWNRKSLLDKYFYAVEITDLDSATGFDGAILVECRSCSIPDKIHRLAAYDCFDAHESNLIHQLYALQSYGYHDTNSTDVFQPEENCPIHYDGWIAEKKTESEILSFIENKVSGYCDCLF